jgi:hypothetical protein
MSELPPPLPPAERTVGQLVAEAIRAYGDNFWRVLPLGVPLALLDELALGRSGLDWLVRFLACAPLLALAFASACTIVAGVPATPRRLATATLTGTIVLLPTAALLPWFALLAVAYLALAGLAVPAAVVEGKGPLDALRRAVALGRADYVHALGSLATLVLLFFLSKVVLVLLLQGQADNTLRAAIFLADVVLTPVMLLGAAILYGDQAARLERGRPRRRGAGRRDGGGARGTGARAPR